MGIVACLKTCQAKISGEYKVHLVGHALPAVLSNTVGPVRPAIFASVAGPAVSSST